MVEERHFYARKFDNEADAKVCWEKARALFQPGMGVGIVRMVAPDDGHEVVVLWWKEDLLEGGEPWEVPEQLQHALAERRRRKGVEAHLSGQKAYEWRGGLRGFDEHGRDVDTGRDN